MSDTYQTFVDSASQLLRFEERILFGFGGCRWDCKAFGLLPFWSARHKTCADADIISPKAWKIKKGKFVKDLIAGSIFEDW